MEDQPEPQTCLKCKKTYYAVYDAGLCDECFMEDCPCEDCRKEREEKTKE